MIPDLVENPATWSRPSNTRRQYGYSAFQELCIYPGGGKNDRRGEPVGPEPIIVAVGMY